MLSIIHVHVFLFDQTKITFNSVMSGSPVSTWAPFGQSSIKNAGYLLCPHHSPKSYNLPHLYSLSSNTTGIFPLRIKFSHSRVLINGLIRKSNGPSLPFRTKAQETGSDGFLGWILDIWKPLRRTTGPKNGTGTLGLLWHETWVDIGLRPLGCVGLMRYPRVL